MMIFERCKVEKIARGAQFIVAPILDLPTLELCVERDVPAMPGAFTPTEIQTAWTADAAVVKVFPATKLGPGYFRDLLAPLPHPKLMPTGGVDLENCGDFIRAGAIAVGVGSAIGRNEWVENGGRIWDRLALFGRVFPVELLPQ